MKKLIVIAVLAVCMAGVAQADPFSSVINMNQKISEQSNGDPGSFTYYHNLGLATPPLTIPGDVVTSATLTLTFSDDEDPQSYYGYVWESSYEYGLLTLDGHNVWGWTELNDGSYPTAVNVDWLNTDGMLQVKVSIDDSSYGTADIWLTKSDLSGEYTPAQVPVPAAVLLGMLGLSVAGVKLRKQA